MTSLKTFPGAHKYAPSRPRILGIHSHFFWAFQRMATAAGHSSHAVVRMRPRYLKAFTWVIGRKYDLKDLSVPAMASFANNLYRFLSDPFAHL